MREFAFKALVADAGYTSNRAVCACKLPGELVTHFSPHDPKPLNHISKSLRSIHKGNAALSDVGLAVYFVQVDLQELELLLEHEHAYLALPNIRPIQRI